MQVFVRDLVAFDLKILNAVQEERFVFRLQTKLGKADVVPPGQW